MDSNNEQTSLNAETSRRIFKMHNIIDLTMEHIKERLVGEKSPLEKLLLEHKIEHSDAIVQSFSKHFNPKVQANEVCEDSKVFESASSMPERTSEGDWRPSGIPGADLVAHQLNAYQTGLTLLSGRTAVQHLHVQTLNDKVNQLRNENDELLKQIGDDNL